MAQIASAQSTLDRVTIPFPSELAGPGSERREGSSSRSGFYSGTRLQQIHSAAAFASIAPQGGWIDAVGFRADHSWRGNINRQMKGIQLRMGTTPLAPDSLKREFRENLTTGLKEVRSPEFSSELELASDGKQAIGPMAYIYLETPFF